MPSTLVHMETAEVASLIDLSGFKDRRGETVIKLLLPGCGSTDHRMCQVMVPRIGTKESPRQWVGWYHCSCECHTFVETETGWEVKPRADKR